MRSKQARRKSVTFSVSGEKLSFCFAIALNRKASIGVRARSLGFVAGIFGWRIGWNDQKARSSSVMTAPLGNSVGSGRVVLAPVAIQVLIIATCTGVSFFSRFGISPL